MKAKINSHHKNRRPTIAFLNKFLVLYVLVLVAFLSSCATTAPNIKSVDDLNEKKLLVGRFMFYVNKELVESYQLEKSLSPVARRNKSNLDRKDKKFGTGFEVFFKKKSGKAGEFELDEFGYVYIPVRKGQYYFTGIRYNYMFATHSFRLHMKPININISDKVINFGTIKVEFKQSIPSKAVGALQGGISLASGLIFPSIAPANLEIIQTSDWDVPRHYISSKFSIPPELIRDEVVSLSVTTRRAIAKYNDEITITKEEYQYSSHDWYSKGLSELTGGNYPTVISCMSKAIELGQGDTGAYYCRGYAFFKLNQFEKAIEDYSKAVELDPKNAGFCMSLIEMNIIAGNYEGVLDNIKKTSFLPLGIKDKAILIYLECIAKKLLNKDTIQCEEELNKILKNKFTTKWSFNEIESWLENANIDYDKKSFIKKKTKLIKKHKK